MGALLSWNPSIRSVASSDGRCDRLGDSPEVVDQSFVMSATFFDQAFLLVVVVVSIFLLLFSLFFPIFIVSIGESEHRADVTEREICSGKTSAFRYEERIWASLKDVVVSGREISKTVG